MILLNRSEDNILVPTNDHELKAALLKHVGIVIPDIQVCANHTTPFRAFSDAYFARYPVTVWKASRGFGGKSLALAALSFFEAATLGASVSLLGGSGEQSRRVHDYMTGEDANVPNTFWKALDAPRNLLLGEPTATITRLVNGGRIRVLTASSKSVRGPHPQRMRGDEVDEMELEILDAAMGQPMSTHMIKKQTVLSSTHHYANGTMTEVLRRAGDKDWPVYEWCYKETSAGDGWLPVEEVESKRGEVTAYMWQNEYDLQEPSPESRAIMQAKVSLMFQRSLGEYSGAVGEVAIFEEFTEIGSYVIGGDWARKGDWTVIVVMRIDLDPMRIVAFCRTGREDWPIMVSKFDDLAIKYHAVAGHDATGIGDVVAGYLAGEAEDIIMVGRTRSDLLSNYIAAVEHEEIVSPYIKFMETEHRLASVDDIYGGGHLPDSIAAGAIAYSLVSQYTDYASYDDGLGHVENYKNKWA